MKRIHWLLAAVLVMAISCRRENYDASSIEATVSNASLLPLPCHSKTFLTEYPVKPGEVPPFRFTKILWPDTRVKSINMYSRVYPIYPGYQKQAVQLTGTFTYATNQAFLKGTAKTWEYFRNSSGAADKRLIATKDINWFFYINSNGFCDYMEDRNRVVGAGNPPIVDNRILDITYDNQNPFKINVIDVIRYGSEFDQSAHLVANHDQYGNILSFNLPHHPRHSSTTYSYDYSLQRGSKNYSFIPSQNLISQEYSLLEVMQWVPQPTHQRNGVAGVFFLPNGTKVVQSQVYKNYQFDSEGNQTSVTYGDNVPQRTTWYCK